MKSLEMRMERVGVLEFLPACDWFGENGLHHAPPPQIHLRSSSISSLRLPPLARLGRTRQRRQEVHHYRVGLSSGPVTEEKK